MLYNTNYGFMDYRHLITEITNLLLTVVYSHGHDDHVPNCFLFEQAYISPPFFPYA